MTNNISIPPNSLHTSLLTNSSNVSSTDLLSPIHEIFKIDIFTQTHFTSDSLVDESALSSIRIGLLDLAVEAAGTQQSRVDSVGSVGGHDDLDVDCLVEAVHLVEQFDQHALHFTVGGVGRVETLGGDGIHFVDEDDGGCVFFCQAEHVAHHAWTLTELLLDELTPDHADEGCRGLVGHRLGHHRLTSTRRAVHQDPAGWVNADALLVLGMREWQLNSLPHFLLL